MDAFSNQLIPGSGDINVTEIVSVTHDTNLSHWKYTSNSQQCYKMHFTLKGKYQRVNDDFCDICSEGSLCFSLPDSFYKSNSITPPTEMVGIYFKAEIPDGESIFLSNFAIHNCNESVKNAFKNMSRLYLTKESNYLIKIKRELYGILAYIADASEKKALKNTCWYTLRRAVEYIKENYRSEEISVEYLAELCKITPAYFCRLFKSLFGVAPKKYIMNLKMEAAAELLLFTSIPVSQIGEQLGYSQFSYFTTAFKSHFGVPPSEYRRGNT